MLNYSVVVLQCEPSDKVTFFLNVRKLVFTRASSNSIRVRTARYCAHSSRNNYLVNNSTFN